MDTTHFHPMMVHFPVALIMAGFFLDVISLFFKKEKCLSKAGFYLMLLGTLGCVGGYLTGEFFTEELTGEVGEIKETHEIFAKTTMFLMLAASALRIYTVIKKKENTYLKWVIFILFFISVLTVGYTGFLGGNMVYNYMIGV